MQQTVKIDPDKYYSATQVMKLGLLPIINRETGLIKSLMTFTMILRTEAGQKLFKPVIRHAAKNDRYFIKGSTLVEIQKLENINKLEI